MKTFSISEPQTESEFNDYYRIRYEILRKPWNQPEKSTKDDTELISVHLLAKDENGKAVATGRLQFNSDEEAQIRSMAVVDEFQGNGIGSLLIEHLEKIAKQRKLKRITLDSRENAVQFYLRNGYRIIEPSYLLFGTIKHFKMQKDL
ncbi:MAG: GNAT family N-acetyltransferase [Bacteroidota bacterium]